jgi:hypothetical protein
VSRLAGRRTRKKVVGWISKGGNHVLGIDAQILLHPLPPREGLVVGHILGQPHQ